MKVAILHSWAPFASGETEPLARELHRQLTVRGHTAIVVRIPFSAATPQKLIEHVLASRLLSLRGYQPVERAIALDFPAYFVPHENKVVWMARQLREAYDGWDAAYPDAAGTANAVRIREAAQRADREYLPEARKIYVQSAVARQRLEESTGIGSEILYVPLCEPEGLSYPDCEEYLFCADRRSAGSRLALVLESLAYTRTPVRLVIAGSPSDVEPVGNLIRKFGLEARVQFLPCPLLESEKRYWLGHALACLDVQREEDSCGQAAQEACCARKAVIACADSWGAGIVVKDGETGLITTPSPEAIAGAMDRLYEERDSARRMGAAACERMKMLGVNWDATVERLTT